MFVYNNICVSFYEKEKEKEMLVRFFLFFLIFWKVFFEEGKEKNFFVFSAFFEERIEKILIIFGEIREKGKMDLARTKKSF